MKKSIFLTLVAMIVIVALVCAGCAQQAEPAASDDGAAAEADASSVELPKGGHVEAEEVAKEPIRIAFLSFQNNPFWNAIKEGSVASTEYLKNFNTTVDYISVGEELTADRVIAAIEGAIEKEYDGIVVAPVFDGVEEYINKAVDAGIPVGTYCAEGTDPGKRLFYYGQNGYAAGQLAGSLIEDYVGDEGKIGVITGVLGAPIHDARMNGALDYLKENDPKIEIIGPFENNDKGETAYSQTVDMLTANPDIKLIYVTAGGPFGSAKAIQDQGLTGKVGVVAYDHIPENLEYVASGEIIGLINQDPFGQGFDTAVIMHNYLVSGTQPKEFYEAALDVVNPDNVGEFYPDYK